MHPRVLTLTVALSTLVLSTVSGCTAGGPHHPVTPVATVAAASFARMSAPILRGPTSMVTVVSSVPVTTTAAAPSGRDAVLAAYARYVAARSKSAVTHGASGAAAYRLAHRQGAPAVVTVHAARYGVTSAAVEECANGSERLVVLTLGVGGWVVSHVIGAGAIGEWCE